MDPDQTAPIEQSVLGPHCLLLYLNSSLMFGNYLQQTTSADDIFRCIFLGALRVNFQMKVKNCVGHDVRKSVLGGGGGVGVENNKGADQTRLLAAVRP